MLAIPIEQSLLYVQPLYLAAEKGSLPELKRVIVSMGNQIAMEENLEASLAQLFGIGGRALTASKGEAAPPAAPALGRESGIRSLVDQAWQQYGRAQELLRQGNFAGYGEELKRLENSLKAMRERAK
jgi:uncharacterized membrane protein (UPF0182 family)